MLPLVPLPLLSPGPLQAPSSLVASAHSAAHAAWLLKLSLESTTWAAGWHRGELPGMRAAERGPAPAAAGGWRRRRRKRQAHGCPLCHRLCVSTHWQSADSFRPSDAAGHPSPLAGVAERRLGGLQRPARTAIGMRYRCTDRAARLRAGGMRPARGSCGRCPGPALKAPARAAIGLSRPSHTVRPPSIAPRRMRS